MFLIWLMGVKLNCWSRCHPQEKKGTSDFTLRHALKRFMENSKDFLTLGLKDGRTPEPAMFQKMLA